MTDASIAIPIPDAEAKGPRDRIPIYVGFREEILPVLAALWAALLVAWFATSQPIFWALIPWATVTTLMLWPVARRLGRAYLSYRSPLFILGVLSMAYIIVTGLVLQSAAPYPVKLAVFLALPIDLTVFAILPSLKWAIGKPVRMFFRPDLIFGDGRVLCCGSLALVLGLRYFVGHPPPEGIPVPIPRWDWWAILWAIALGFVPLIALRGVLKLLMRLRRLRDDRWYGWWPTAVRELLLVATVLMIGFGFHNVFKGFTPFVESHTAFHEFSWVPLLGLAGGAAFLIFVRGGYKRWIGEPFIRETVAQSFAKQVLYVVGIVVVMWSFMSILDTELGDIKRAGYHHLTWIGDQPGHGGEAHATTAASWPESGFILPGIKGLILGPWNWVGLALVAWGVVVLVPFRVLAQHYQRHAIVAQMAAVILPSFTAEQRQKVLHKVMLALDAMPTARAGSYMRSMLEGLDAIPDGARDVMARSRVQVLAACAIPTRDHLMECMADALGRLNESQRVRAIADTMAAVSQLPSEQRQAFMAKMVSLMR